MQFFKDSLQFLPCGLDKLIENLVDNEKAENNHNVFKQLSSEFKDEQLQLLRKKEIFPLEYLDSFDRAKNTIIRKRTFLQYIKNYNISKQDYEYAINVRNKFNMKTFGDYHDIYLKSDVLLLADIVENFRFMLKLL